MSRKNGNIVRKVEVLKRVKELGENEEKLVKVTSELGDGYKCTIGNYRKNNRGSFQIRVKYGINTLLKIRNTVEFEQIKRVINFLDEHPEYIKALDELNGVTKKSDSSKDEEFI